MVISRVMIMRTTYLYGLIIQRLYCVCAVSANFYRSTFQAQNRTQRSDINAFKRYHGDTLLFFLRDVLTTEIHKREYFICRLFVHIMRHISFCLCFDRRKKKMRLYNKESKKDFSRKTNLFPGNLFRV